MPEMAPITVPLSKAEYEIKCRLFEKSFHSFVKLPSTNIIPSFLKGNVVHVEFEIAFIKSIENKIILKLLSK